MPCSVQKASLVDHGGPFCPYNLWVWMKCFQGEPRFSEKWSLWFSRYLSFVCVSAHLFMLGWPSTERWVIQFWNLCKTGALAPCIHESHKVLCLKIRILIPVEFQFGGLHFAWQIPLASNWIYSSLHFICCTVFLSIAKTASLFTPEMVAFLWWVKCLIKWSKPNI